MYQTYGCKAQGEKLPWAFSRTIESATRKDAARVRNELLVERTGGQKWTLTVTITPGGRRLLQSIPGAIA